MVLKKHPFTDKMYDYDYEFYDYEFYDYDYEIHIFKTNFFYIHYMNAILHNYNANLVYNYENSNI